MLNCQTIVKKSQLSRQVWRVCHREFLQRSFEWSIELQNLWLFFNDFSAITLLEWTLLIFCSVCSSFISCCSSYLHIAQPFSQLPLLLLYLYITEYQLDMTSKPRFNCCPVGPDQIALVWSSEKSFWRYFSFHRQERGFIAAFKSRSCQALWSHKLENSCCILTRQICLSSWCFASKMKDWIQVTYATFPLHGMAWLSSTQYYY